jgi:hypothetical protein
VVGATKRMSASCLALGPASRPSFPLDGVAAPAPLLDVLQVRIVRQSLSRQPALRRLLKSSEARS